MEDKYQFEYKCERCEEVFVMKNPYITSKKAAEDFLREIMTSAAISTCHDCAGGIGRVRLIGARKVEE